MSLKSEKIKQKYSGMQSRAYVRLGAQKLIQQPVINIVTVLIIVLTIFMWKLKDYVLTLLSPHGVLSNLLNLCIPVIFISIPVLMFFALLEFLGKRIAEPIEDNLSLLFGDNEPYPVLLSYKKKDNIIHAAFYSDRITLNNWHNPEAFEKAFRGKLISVKLGSKYKKRSSHFIIQYTDSLEQADKGDLTDTPFPVDSRI